MIATWLRRLGLSLIVVISVTAGDIQARGYLPPGAWLVFLAVAILIAAVCHGADALDRAERRQLRHQRSEIKALNRKVLDQDTWLIHLMGDRDRWRAWWIWEHRKLVDQQAAADRHPSVEEVAL